MDHAGNLPNLVKQLRRPDPLHLRHARPVRHHAAGLRAHSGTGRAVRFQSRARKNISRRSSRFIPSPDAEKACSNLSPHDYEKPFQPVAGVTVTFRDAGHILGSAQVILDVQENGRKFRWLFSGDVGPRRR